jgi:cellulose synthase operon protein C
MTGRRKCAGVLRQAALLVLALGIASSAVSASAAPTAPAATPAAGATRCQGLRRHGHASEARACYLALIEHGTGAGERAEGYWGLERYAEANEAFRRAVGEDERGAHWRVRWALLLHERFNDRDAEQLLHEALERGPQDAEALLGLATVSADGFDGRAAEWARRALASDPRLATAHELLANLALEDADAQQAAREADAALALDPSSLDALAIHASIELLADRAPQAWFARIAAINPTYAPGYALAAHHLILRTRYEDGVEYYRKALTLDPHLWSARADLGVNLMRLGRDTEARSELTQCYEAGYRDEATVNSLRLLDSLANFVNEKGEGFVLRLHRKEAALLAPYFKAQLARDLADYSRKYQMHLPGPVQVEVYPDHEDFAVRTLGVPGLGALGVTFGATVAMDSPSARKPGEFHWASTLRHEMSHVFILTATQHRVPRWFTEGLAVHEETQASPEWGDPMTPDIVAALAARKLLPVADLDRGFVRPEYPAQVIVSYFEAGRICDYIQSRWGESKLLDLVHAFAARKGTRDALSAELGVAAEDFDREFQSWLYRSVGPTVDGFARWRAALAHLGERAPGADPPAVIREGEAVIALYPDYVYQGNAYERVAAAHLAQRDRSSAARVLAAYQSRGGRDPQTLKELAQLYEQLGDPQRAAATLERINLIDPAYDEELHRHLGELWLGEQNTAGAIMEFQAVLALHPLDQASAHYHLAQAYLAAGQRDQAEDAVLAALESAPGYRPAQQLLLKLHSQ